MLKPAAIRIGTFFTRDWGEVALWQALYAVNGATAVVLTSTQARDTLRPVAVLSVNMEGSRGLPSNCFYMKDWTENERLAEDARNSGWLRARDFDLPTSDNGYVQAKPYEILRKRVGVMHEAQPTPAPTPAPTEEGRWAYTPGGTEPIFEPATPKFESGGGGDYGGGGASSSWEDSPSPAPEPPASPPPSDSGTSWND